MDSIATHHAAYWAFMTSKKDVDTHTSELCKHAFYAGLMALRSEIYNSGSGAAIPPHIEDELRAYFAARTPT